MLQIPDWYTDGFDSPHKYGESVLISPETWVFIPARINLRAVIESERRIKSNEYLSHTRLDREVPSLFWDENLVPSDGNVYVFETRYCTESDEILPLSYLSQIPERLTKKFLREVPSRVSELADKLVGVETDTRTLLRKFYEFVAEHRIYQTPTSGKPIEQLLSEYERVGYFYGNCTESRNFYAALCDAKGLPTKKVSGKSFLAEGHAWVDVFVPTDGGYKLLPVDPSLEYFGNLYPAQHLFMEYTPGISQIGIGDRIFNFVARKVEIRDYQLKIETKE